MENLGTLLGSQRVCTYCKEGALVDLKGPDGNQAYIRFSVSDKANVIQGNLVIGGPGFATICKVCNKCGYVHFFFDQEATHGRK